MANCFVVQFVSFAVVVVVATAVDGGAVLVGVVDDVELHAPANRAIARSEAGSRRWVISLNVTGEPGKMWS